MTPPTDAPAGPLIDGPTDVSGLPRLSIVTDRRVTIAQQLRAQGLGVGSEIVTAEAWHDKPGWTERRSILTAIGESRTLWKSRSLHSDDEPGGWSEWHEEIDWNLSIYTAAWHVLNAVPPAAPFGPTAPPAAERAGLGVGWRDIGSAPKGPHLLLGFFNRARKWRSTRGCWLTADELEERDTDGEWDDYEAGWFEEPVEGEQCFRTNPTHWQPLPPPPGAAP